MDIHSDKETDVIRPKIISFIKERTGGRELQLDEDIFATGYVSSLFVVQLITWLEKTFRLSIDSAELDIKNFRTIDAIARLVSSKTMHRTAKVMDRS